MKALVLQKPNQFELSDVPMPSFGAEEVLIRIKACGICGSDIHGMDGSSGRRQPPLIMGHEASGIIAEVGDNVTSWNKGDGVTFDSTVYCGACPYCREGNVNICDNRRVLGVSCDDYHLDGAFAEYVVVPQHILYRLPDTLTFVQGAMVEAVSIAVHAVNRTPMVPTDTALVIGAGMIGLLVVQVLYAAKCAKIIAVDIEQSRLEMAGRLGADVKLLSNACDVPVAVLEQTNNRGADIAFEAVGIEQTINMAIGSLRKGGSLTMIGNVSPKIDMPLQQIVTRELTLYGSCASAGEYPACLEMIAEGKVDVDALISATAPLAEGATWFKKLYKQEDNLMKVILEP
jgi:L-iditol 2-dehydrogenase